MPDEVTPPEDWVKAQFTRANALRNLTAGDRERNLREAITCYQDVLRDWTEADRPQDWASAQECLGMTYWYLYMADSGDKIETLHAAIDCYHASLRVRTEAADPQEWAMTQNTLAWPCEALAYETHGALGYDYRDSAWYRSAQEAYAAAERGYLAAGMKPQAAQMRSNLAGRESRGVLSRLTGWLSGRRG